MNRVFLDIEGSILFDPDPTIELGPDLSHHLRDVLRLKEGNQLIAVSQDSAEEYLAIVADSGSLTPRQLGPVRIKIISKLVHRQIRTIVSSLICAIPKGAHSDQICEQVAQLGVDRIIFWQADRSVLKISNPASKLDRWRKIVEASARQSCGLKIPELSFFQSTKELVAALESSIISSGDMLAVCSLSKDAKLPIETQVPQSRLHLVIGPEGDLSTAEQEQFLKLGAVMLSLGPYVLRVETAAIVAVAMAEAVWARR